MKATFGAVLGDRVSSAPFTYLKELHHREQCLD